MKLTLEIEAEAAAGFSETDIGIVRETRVSSSSRPSRPASATEI